VPEILRVATPEPSPWTGRRKLAVGAAGVSVVGLATGVTFAVLAKNKEDGAESLCPGSVCNSAGDIAIATTKIHDAKSRAVVANVALGVAGAGAIAAGVLWLTGAPERHDVAIVPGAGTVSIAGRW
jgi:hypothetical protein